MLKCRAKCNETMRRINHLIRNCIQTSGQYKLAFDWVNVYRCEIVHSEASEAEKSKRSIFKSWSPCSIHIARSVNSINVEGEQKID